MVEINAGGDDQSGGQSCVDEKEFWRIKKPEDGEEDRGEQFDDGVARIEVGSTTTGAAAKQEVAKNGKIQGSGNFQATGGAAGRGMNDGEAQGPAEDADIQEGTDAGAEAKNRHCLEPGIHRDRPAAFSRAERISGSGAGRPVQICRARAP